MQRLLSRFRRSTRAAAAIEFGIVLPLMLLFVGGIVELGRAFQVYNVVNRLATRYAISWADCSDSPAGYCQTELAEYTNPAAIQNMAPQLNYTATNPVIQMMQVTMSSTNSVQSVSPSTTLTPSQSTAAKTSIGAGNTGVIVTVSYVHSLLFFSQIMSPFFASKGGSSWTISYTVVQRKN